MTTHHLAATALSARARQPLLAALLAAAAVTGFATLPSAALAAAPQVKTQAPGWYRLMIGKFEVTALSDGTVDLPTGQLLHAPAKSHLKPFPATQETSVNAWLVNTGDKLVLIDAGAGTLFGPTLGKAVAQLRAAGYQPEQVDDILVTHMHPDHVGGLAANGQRVFPNATVHASKKEAEYWLSEARLEAAPAEAKDFFRGAIASVGPYEKAGKLATFEGSTEVVTGIRSLASLGHTAGHTAYVVESDGKRLVVAGDTIHVASVQLPSPEVTIGFDTDEKEARSARAHLFAQLAKDDTLVAFSHFSFPGLGHLHAAGKGWSWAPLPYSSQLR